MLCRNEPLQTIFHNRDLLDAGSIPWERIWSYMGMLKFRDLFTSTDLQRTAIDTLHFTGSQIYGTPLRR